METPVVGSSGVVPQVPVQLHNVGREVWEADGLDCDHVSVRALDPDGRPLPVHSEWGFGVVEVHRLTNLAPNEDIELTARWQLQNVERLPPGDYALEAQLLDLALNCPPGMLRFS